MSTLARVKKPPTRRQLAGKILESIPIINSHTQGMDALHDRMARLEAQFADLESMRRWRRLRWLVRG